MVETIKEEIKELEQSLLADSKRLARLKRELPRREIADYVFKADKGRTVNLSELFGDSNDLILIHNMGSSCSYCTKWADGFNSIVKHLETRARFVLVSPDEPEHQMEFARKNGWTFRILSNKDNSINADLGFESESGSPLPGVSTFFRRPDSTIELVAQSPFGPGDLFCSIWHLFDLLATQPAE